MINEYKLVEYFRKQLLVIIDNKEEVSIDGVIERFKEEVEDIDGIFWCEGVEK